MNPTTSQMTNEGIFNLLRIAKAYFERPENRELSRQLAEQDRLEKAKG